jgi:opacity protein-like surface antigen
MRTRIVVNLWLLLAVLLLGVFTVQTLHAQALTTASGGGSYLALGGAVTATRTPYGSRTLLGGLVYTDSNLTPRVGLEYEGRFLRYNLDENVSQTSYLAGARVVLWRGRTQPYVKFMAGLGRMTFPFHYATGSYFVVAPGAGLDYALSDRWTARVVDIEYQDWTGFSFGSMQPYGISSGLRLRLNGIELFPKKMRHRH